jgi:glutamine amidotransferase-like uncharacterized protein
MKINRFGYIKNVLIVLSIFLVTTLVSLSLMAIESDSSNYVHAAGPVTVKVLIYSGNDALSSSVNGIKSSLNYVNSHNTISNVKFTYATSSSINSNILSRYDVLIMPGGISGKSYLRNPRISGANIKKFVSSGKGYIGICAGAYAASYRVDGHYYGWGIASHVNCKHVNYIGQLPISMTSNGKNILKYTGTQTVYHWNGPAMYFKTHAFSMAKYANGKTHYINYNAIVGDTYGSGRVVLSGPHPELYPSKPKMLARMILWAAKKI